MKTPSLNPSANLPPILILLGLLAALVVLSPRQAEARLVVRIGTPHVKVISTPRAKCAVKTKPCVKTYRCEPRKRVVITAGAQRKSVRAVTVQGCDCRTCRPRVKTVERVWVPGHWVKTGPRTSRWVPGHWERV